MAAEVAAEVGLPLVVESNTPGCIAVHKMLGRMRGMLAPGKEGVAPGLLLEGVVVVFAFVAEWLSNTEECKLGGRMMRMEQGIGGLEAEVESLLEVGKAGK